MTSRPKTARPGALAVMMMLAAGATVLSAAQPAAQPSSPAAPAPADARAAKPPNVIVVMVDDFGYECVGANGGRSYKTPHLDRMAAAGVRFSSFHVQPLCTPTRVELMTGKSNVRNYVRFGLLPRSETTFAHLFQKAGYATGIVGKWQLGHEPDSPRHFGFDEAFLWQHTRRPPRYANPGLERDGKELDYKNGEYGPRLLHDFALDFVARHKARPFFLYYPMTLTHDPYQPTPDSPDWDPKAMGEGVNKDVKHFADMVAEADRLVGTLDAKLGDLGLRENTLLIVLGDNGTGRGVTTRTADGEVKGGKGGTTVRGTHVPCIVQWPAGMKGGRVVDDLGAATDVLPTICEAAGITVPAGLDGRSFLPQVKGDKGTPREWLYQWYSPRQGNDPKAREYAFDRAFKLYRTGEFHDLRNDPDEKKSLDTATLTGEAAAAAAKLRAALERYKDARPAAVDREFEASAKSATKKAAKKKAKGSDGGDEP